MTSKLSKNSNSNPDKSSVFSGEFQKAHLPIVVKLVNPDKSRVCSCELTKAASPIVVKLVNPDHLRFLMKNISN